MPMITEQHLPALQGLIPACVTTCSAAGEPNTTVISQVWYVDEDHVALSHQFFNKTRRNIAENPHAVVMILSPENGATFDLSITYARTETEGPLFDKERGCCKYIHNRLYRLSNFCDCLQRSEGFPSIRFTNCFCNFTGQN